MKDPSILDLLVRVLLVTTLLSAPATSSAGLTLRADLTHVDMGRGFTRWELMNRMAARSRARVACSLHHQSRGHNGQPATATLLESSGEYLISFNVGTPRPQRVALNMDTGSDLIWMQCASCLVCFDQSTPMSFDPSKSSTCKPVACPEPICQESLVSACSMGTFGCFYLGAYGDMTITAGNMYRDTFSFKAANSKGGVVAVPDLAFGCGDYNKGVLESTESGIVGFGRGSQSLPSQLKIGKFSYCLTDMYGNKTSTLFLGMPDDLRAHSKGPIQSTPIIQNPGDPSKYFLSLEGITVGKTRLPFDKSVFALRKDGSGGTMIDSGASYTHLPNAVLRHLQSALAAQYPLPVYNNTSEVGDRLCFQLPQGAEPTVPKLIFHLAGADMDLPKDNYMSMDSDLGVVCLMISGTERAKTTIGMLQQQNMHIVYDTDNSKLLFVPAECDKV